MMRSSLALVVITLACSAATISPDPASQATVRPQETAPDATMLRFPDVGGEKIVFVYANDLWTVSRDGGQAAPLASPPGTERFPKFSPDDATIAFMGNYDGNLDLYTIPSIGGVPARVTHHPGGETLCDWAPDGRLLFQARGMTGLERNGKLYLVDRGGGLPESLPVPYGATGAISADGRWLAYTLYTRDARTWKRYRGGMATDVWLFDLQTNESRTITDWEGTDTLPMWHGSKIYYLSDGGENHKLNVWSYDVGSSEREQVTSFEEYDVKWPSMGPGDAGQGEIVLQNGSDLYLVDLAGSGARKVAVTIPGALPTLRTKVVDAAEYLQGWSISPTGKRAVVQARGDVWTLPAENGSPRNLTRTSGVAERDPSWSPDGRWISYFSDQTGEYELYLTQSDGKGETKQITSGLAPFYYYASWSPDSKHIVFADKSWTLHLHTIETGETKTIDQDPWALGMGVSWSHDSRWLTYSHGTDENPVPKVWLYQVETGERHAVTGGMFPDSSPVFDRKGDYLYFVSARAFSPTGSELFMDNAFIYEDTDQILAVPLLEEVESPWLAESDEESWEEEDGEDAAEEGGEDEEGEDAGEEAEEDEGEEKEAVEDDGLSGTWEGMAVTPEGELPVTLSIKLNPDNSVTGTLVSLVYSGDFTGTWDPAASMLTGTVSIPGEGTIVLEMKVDGSTMTGTGTHDGVAAPVTATRVSTGASEEEEDGGETKAREKVEIDLEGFERRAFALPIGKGSFRNLAVNDKNQLLYVRSGEGIRLFDIEDDDKAEKTVTAAAGGFMLSADGKKLLAPMGSSASIYKTSAGASGKKVVTTGMTAYIEPREEWRQLFMDVWRIQRDFFYLENMHGVDWPAMRDRYSKMIDACVSREDVSFILGELIAELNIGHTYYYGGDTEEQPRRNVGLLGVDWKLDQGAYRIAKIYDGAAWDADARNPVNEAGVDVKEGDYLLAVNGVTVDTAKDPWAAFLGLAGRTITVTVSDKPQLDDEARDVVIKPMSSERNLRYRAWIEKNRAYVEAKTDGQVGYVYVPDTAIQGRNDFVRQYYGQIFKKALIIDERWNGGGYDPSCFIDMMHKPVTNFWARREGHDAPQPWNVHQGPKCMLINGLAGSGGDAFPWQFRHQGVGKLIGTRTWGGLVGMAGNPSLIDGGHSTVPNWGFYEIDGTWAVEGHGVDPDIEVVDDPALMLDGGDPQLDAAIEHMLEEIPSYPYVLPKRPVSPNRSGMGLPEEDK